MTRKENQALFPLCTRRESRLSCLFAFSFTCVTVRCEDETVLRSLLTQYPLSLLIESSNSRERERERERGRETERDRDKETERDRQRKRETHTHTHTHTQRPSPNGRDKQRGKDRQSKKRGFEERGFVTANNHLFYGAQIERHEIKRAADPIASVGFEEKRHPSSSQVSIAVILAGNRVDLKEETSYG